MDWQFPLYSWAFWSCCLIFKPYGSGCVWKKWTLDERWLREQKSWGGQENMRDGSLTTLPLKRASLNGGTRFYLPSIHNTDFSLWKVLICFHLQNLSKYVLKSNICTLYLNLNTNKTEIILTSKLTVNFHNKTKVENYKLLERKPFVQCWLKGKKAYPQAQTQHNKLL